MSDWLECGRCGEDCVESDGRGLYFDGQSEKCPGCGAVNVVSADEDDVYVRWTCKHGRDDETPCAECDAEDAAPASSSEHGGAPKEEA